MRAVFLLALVAGCSFPSPEFETTSTDGGVDSTSVSDSAQDSTPPLDTASSPPDTGVVTDASDPCDKDRDGERAQGTVCGGKDCDDDDPRAKPSVSDYVTFDATGKSHAGDWNCDGTVKRQFPINVGCGLLGGSACAATKGFTGNPTCGTSGKYVECGTSGALCVEVTSTTRIQGCY